MHSFVESDKIAETGLILFASKMLEDDVGHLISLERTHSDYLTALSEGHGDLRLRQTGDHCDFDTGSILICIVPCTPCVLPSSAHYIHVA